MTDLRRELIDIIHDQTIQNISYVQASELLDSLVAGDPDVWNTVIEGRAAMVIAIDALRNESRQ